MPAVEHYGIEPIPRELRTAGWRDLFAINFTFFLNPVMYVLGALAVLEGGLPLRWAIAAMVAGQALAFGFLVVVARPGVDDGLPGQVAMRATFGILGARLAHVAVPDGRGDLLVRRPGAHRRPRLPGDRRSDVGTPPAARADGGRARASSTRRWPSSAST